MKQLGTRATENSGLLLRRLLQQVATKPSLPPYPHGPGKVPEFHLAVTPPLPHLSTGTETRDSGLLVCFSGRHHKPSRVPTFPKPSAICLSGPNSICVLLPLLQSFPSSLFRRPAPCPSPLSDSGILQWPPNGFSVSSTFLLQSALTTDPSDWSCCSLVQKPSMGPDYLTKT